MDRCPGLTFEAVGDMTRQQVVHVLFRPHGKRGELIPYGVPERPGPRLTPRQQAERRYLTLGIPAHRLPELLAEDEARAADVERERQARIRELKRRREERERRPRRKRDG